MKIERGNAGRRVASVSGPHWTRRKARRIERELTATWPPKGVSTSGPYLAMWVKAANAFLGIPVWASGFRVRRVGPLAWQVEATEWTGH